MQQMWTRVMFGVLVVVGVAAQVDAAPRTGRGAVARQRQELRQDHRDLRRDQRELRRDRRRGASPGELRQDRRDLRRDHQELRQDRRELRRLHRGPNRAR